MARELALPVFDKKDSTGICFIGERPFAEFLAQYLPAQPGDIETAEGRKVGEHRGLMYYTLGQRQGLRIGGRSDASEEAWYVADKDLRRNVLVVVQGHDHPSLFSRGLTASQLTWVAGEAPAAQFRGTAKVRYRQPDQDCEVRVLANGRCAVEFDSAAARRHAGAVRGVLSRRGMPGRRRHRGVSRASPAAIIRALWRAQSRLPYLSEYRWLSHHIFYPRPCKR